MNEKNKINVVATALVILCLLGIVIASLLIFKQWVTVWLCAERRVTEFYI